jgi:hypothetical protein
MSVLDKFEADHPGCVVKNMPVTTAGGSEMSCDVIVVPKHGWQLDEEPTHRDDELVVSVAPHSPLAGDWPLVLVDVYLLGPEDLHARLRSGKTEPSSNVLEYTPVGPAACVHLGEAALTSLLGEEKTTSRGLQLLHCQYDIDLGYDDEVSASETARLKLAFQVRKAPRPAPLTRQRTVGSIGSIKANLQALKACIA